MLWNKDRAALTQYSLQDSGSAVWKLQLTCWRNCVVDNTFTTLLFIDLLWEPVLIPVALLSTPTTITLKIPSQFLFSNLSEVLCNWSPSSSMLVTCGYQNGLLTIQPRSIRVWWFLHPQCGGKCISWLALWCLMTFKRAPEHVLTLKCDGIRLHFWFSK